MAGSGAQPQHGGVLGSWRQNQLPKLVLWAVPAAVPTWEVLPLPQAGLNRAQGCDLTPHASLPCCPACICCASAFFLCWGSPGQLAEPRDGLRCSLSWLLHAEAAHACVHRDAPSSPWLICCSEKQTHKAAHRGTAVKAVLRLWFCCAELQAHL